MDAAFHQLMARARRMQAETYRTEAEATLIDPHLPDAARAEHHAHLLEMAASYDGMARLFDTLSQPAQEGTAP